MSISKGTLSDISRDVPAPSDGISLFPPDKKSLISAQRFQDSTPILQQATELFHGFFVKFLKI